MAMRVAFVLPLIIGLIIVMAYLIVNATKRTSVELMILGIGVSIVGGIIAIDPNSNLMGIEYLLVFLGLALEIIGFIKGK